MSYELYSEGLVKQYLEVVEKTLAGEYMQSFLKLFESPPVAKSKKTGAIQVFLAEAELFMISMDSSCRTKELK